MLELTGQTSGPLKSKGVRRFVTVLFSDVSGSSQHAEMLDAEDYADKLDQFRKIVRDVVPRHGGSIARMQGDGVLALFGYDESREDDGRRAVEAAFELHSAVKSIDFGSGANAAFMELHSGIHAGLVLLIEGDIERGRFDVVGEVPNTASRLCSMAAKGEIMVSEESLGPQAHFFSLSSRQNLAVRGRANPLTVVRVDGRAAVRRRIEAAAKRGVVPFVGRLAPMTQLLRAAENLGKGLRGGVVISGEAGLGKTRLVSEFRRQAESQGLLTVQGYCENYLGAEPFQPFWQILRSALGWTVTMDGADLAEKIRNLTGGKPNEAGDRLAAGARAVLLELSRQKQTSVAPLLASAILALLEVLAQGNRLVLVLDDWQWADDASRQMLDTIWQGDLKLLVVVATRPVEEADRILKGVAPLKLQPLEPAEAETTIHAWLPYADPILLQEVTSQSGGSPLFIEELCHAAAAGGDFRSLQDKSGVAWISALVASRVARLPSAQIECLQAASILGMVFPSTLLSRLIASGEAAGLIGALVANDFLTESNGSGLLRFNHVLTRESVYATVDAHRRRELHLRAALLIENGGEGGGLVDNTETLSYHFAAAGQSVKAAKYAEAAGDKALAMMALDRGRAQFATTLRSLDAIPELTNEDKHRWCSVAQRLGLTCVFDALDVADLLQLLQRAAALAREIGDGNVIARAEYWLGYVNYGRGQPRAAIAHCRQALKHATDSQDVKLMAQVQATLGQSLASAGQYHEALPLLRDSVQSKKQQSRPGSGTAIGSAYTLARTAYTLGDLGRFDEAYELFSESLEMLGDKLHAVKASVKELMCAVYLWQGRWDEAAAAGIEGTDIALTCRSHFNTAMGRALSSCAVWARDRDQASVELLLESTRWIEVRGGAVSTSLNYGWLVEMMVARQWKAQARQSAHQLFLRARAQDWHGVAMGCRAMAKLAMHNQDERRALAYLWRADHAAALRNSPRENAVNLLARADLLLFAGKGEQARPPALKALGLFEAMQMPWFAAEARKVLGQV